MKKIILVILSLLFGGSTVFAKEALKPANGEQPTYCEQVAFFILSSTGSEEKPILYNQELIDDSKKCFEHELGQERGLEVLKFGMAEFDRNESERGESVICTDLLKAFPEYIRK